MLKETVLIVGASSTIAQAIVAELLTSQPDVEIIIVSRDLSAYNHFKNPKLTQAVVEDYQLSSLEQTVVTIQQSATAVIKQIYICHGLLHNSEITPEKRLEDFCPEAFLAIIKVNALIPMLWIKALAPLLSNKHQCKLIIFSARVGSIEDNQLGGWYSYRASKAALNMMLKNVAIEFSRRSKSTKVIIFHPGTTDTPLSQPFQKNVPTGKLFSAKFVAQQLLNIVALQPFDQQAVFLDWQGKKYRGNGIIISNLKVQLIANQIATALAVSNLASLLNTPYY